MCESVRQKLGHTIIHSSIYKLQTQTFLTLEAMLKKVEVPHWFFLGSGFQRPELESPELLPAINWILFLFIFLGRSTTSYANCKFRGTLFSKSMPNFYRPHAMSIHKIQQLKPIYFFDKIKHILYQKVRNSMS